MERPFVPSMVKLALALLLVACAATSTQNNLAIAWSGHGEHGEHSGTSGRCTMCDCCYTFVCDTSHWAVCQIPYCGLHSDSDCTNEPIEG
jgi:hypothetical protein